MVSSRIVPRASPNTLEAGEHQHVELGDALLRTDERHLQERPADQGRQHERDAAQHQHRRDGERGRVQGVGLGEADERQVDGQRQAGGVLVFDAAAVLHEHAVVHAGDLHRLFGDGRGEWLEVAARLRVGGRREQGVERHRGQFVGATAVGVHDSPVRRGQGQRVEGPLPEIVPEDLSQCVTRGHVDGHGGLGGHGRRRACRVQTDAERVALADDAGAVAGERLLEGVRRRVWSFDGGGGEDGILQVPDRRLDPRRRCTPVRPPPAPARRGRCARGCRGGCRSGWRGPRAGGSCGFAGSAGDPGSSPNRPRPARRAAAGSGRRPLRASASSRRG